MPELPEVQTVLDTLANQIQDLTITDVTVNYPKMVHCDLTRFVSTLKGNAFRRFERRGKYLIFRMDTCTLVCHLRMEGRFYLQDPKDPINAHMHVIFDLSDGRQMRYMDTRKFGTMELYEADHCFDTFRDLGPEPYDPSFDAEYVHMYCKGRNIPLKSLLLEQHFVAGIGNIYADEILFACGLRPGRSCRRITKNDEQHIVDETRRILHEATMAGGTTIRSYVSSLGVTGRFQLSCMVHAKEKCQVCGSDIRVKKIGGRSSYYCPVCQK